MPIQQTTTDMHSAPQKLSKIETLRLARNYIIAMSQTLQEGRPMSLPRFIRILSRELSQTTANLLMGTLMGFGSNSSHVDYRKIYFGNYDNSAYGYGYMDNLHSPEQKTEFNMNVYKNDYPYYYRSHIDSVITHTDNMRCWENNYVPTEAVMFSNSCAYSSNYNGKSFCNV